MREYGEKTPTKEYYPGNIGLSLSGTSLGKSSANPTTVIYGIEEDEIEGIVLM